MQPRYVLEGVVHEVTPLCAGDAMTLEIDGHRLDTRLLWHGHHEGELVINGSPSRFYAAQDGNTLYLHLAGRVWVLEAQDEFSESRDKSASAGVVHAPMPGVVMEINVAPGDQVEPGQPLMLIESMKLQTEIQASVAGTVAAIGAEVGESFDKGAVLVDIEVETADTDSSE